MTHPRDLIMQFAEIVNVPSDGLRIVRSLSDEQSIVVAVLLECILKLSIKNPQIITQLDTSSDPVPNTRTLPSGYSN